MRNIIKLFLSALIMAFLCCVVAQPLRASTITIGETNVLSTADSGNGNLLAAQNATLSQPAIIDSLSFYVSQASGNLILGIYDASGPNGGPGALKAQTNSVTPVVGWNTAKVITPVSLPAGTYWLAYLPSSNSLAFMKGQTSGVSNRYYSYAFGALPATFSTSPSSDPYHWSFYATLNPAPTISSVSLSKSSFAAGAPSGTVVGAISVNMSSGSFTGSLSLSGANASSFKIVGSNLETNAVLPAGSYALNIVATESGAANSPFSQAEAITGVSTSISSVSLSNVSFVGGSPSGTVVGTIAVTMSPSSPAFSGSLSLSTTQGGCTVINGANNSSFVISGNSLVTNGIVAPGSYAVCILATQASASNSPVGQAEGLTGRSTTVTIGETNVLSTGDSGNGNLLAAQNATLSQPAIIDSLSFYVTQASGNLILGIYDASGPNGGPGALKAQTNSVTPAVGWNTANVITPVSLPAGTYWLAYLPSSNSLAFMKGQTSSVSNRYYSYAFGALPATFSTSPSSDPYHWSFYATLNTGAVSQSISSVSLSKSSVIGGAPSGTVVGTINVAMSPSSPAFSGSLSLSTAQGGCTATNGANNSKFAISGNNLVTNGTLAPGTYAICLLASQVGATNSPLGQALKITGSSALPTILAVNLSCGVNCSVTQANAVAGSLIGSLSATVSSGTFAGTFQPSQTATNCNAGNGADNSRFVVNGTNLNVGATNLTAGGGSGTGGVYNLCIAASDSNYSNSPLGVPFSVTVTSGGTPTAYLSASNLETTSLNSGRNTTIPNGGTATLTWDSSNAASCIGTGFTAGTAGIGTATVSPTSGVNTYSVNCGGAISSVTVTVSGTRRNAATGFCAANGGGDGSSGNPWHAACINAAIAAAASGDTVFLAAGNWQLNTADPAGVLTGKTINLVGAGSGNTFDAYGHVNNANGIRLTAPTSQAGQTVTRIFTTGTSCDSGGGCSGGFMSFNASCSNVTVSHIFFDGSAATAGGNQWAILGIYNCPGPTTVSDIRLLATNFTNTNQNPETQFWLSNDANVTVQQSVFANPLQSSPPPSYQLSQVFESVLNRGPLIINNNVFFQGAYNPTDDDNVTYTANYADMTQTTQWYPGYALTGCGLNPGNIGGHECGANGQNIGTWHSTIANNYFNTGNTTAIGGGVNDPATTGVLSDQHWTGNWINGGSGTAAIDSCIWHPFGSCGGMNGENQGADTNCVPTNNGSQWVITNNSVIGGTAQLNLSGQAAATACWNAANPNGTLIAANIYNAVAQKNYFRSSSNQYLSNSFTINPTIGSGATANFCAGAGGAGTIPNCATTGFNTPPTISFTLGNLSGSTVTINKPSFTAQYGAVQWLASTSSTTPLSSDARWSSNGAALPGSYIPPASLSGVAHGNTVYMWVMDSNNNISTVASQVVP